MYVHGVNESCTIAYILVGVRQMTLWEVSKNSEGWVKAGARMFKSRTEPNQKTHYQCTPPEKIKN